MRILFTVLCSAVVLTASAVELDEVLSAHAGRSQLHGKLESVLTPLDEDLPGSTHHVEFWIRVPGDYHLVVTEPEVVGDSQHYISDGVHRWHVEVVLGMTPIVDERAVEAADRDFFDDIRALLRLDRGELEADFVLGLEPAAGHALPADWQAQHVLLLVPDSPEQRSQWRRIVIALGPGPEFPLVGLVVDDVNDNRRTVTVRELDAGDDITDAHFTWPED